MEYYSNEIIVIFKSEFDEVVWMWIIFKSDSSPGLNCYETVTLFVSPYVSHASHPSHSDFNNNVLMYKCLII